MNISPINGKRYKITGDNCCGDWTIVAICRYYRMGSSKRQIRNGYKWVAVGSGNIIHKKEVNKFELI